MRAAILTLALLAPGMALAQQRPAQPPAQRQATLADEVERNIRTCIGTSQDMALVTRCMDGQRAVVAPRLDAAVERLLATQPDPAAIDALLEERQLNYVTIEGWRILDQLEVANGKAVGKPRVKFTRIQDMLAALHAEVHLKQA